MLVPLQPTNKPKNTDRRKCLFGASKTQTAITQINSSLVDANKAIATKNWGSPKNASGNLQNAVSTSEQDSEELSSIFWGKEEVAKPEKTIDRWF